MEDYGLFLQFLTLKKQQSYAVLFQRTELTKSVTLKFSLVSGTIVQFFFPNNHLVIEIPGLLLNGEEMVLSISYTIQSGQVVYNEISFDVYVILNSVRKPIRLS